MDSSSLFRSPISLARSGYHSTFLLRSSPALKMAPNPITLKGAPATGCFKVIKPIFAKIPAYSDGSKDDKKEAAVKALSLFGLEKSAKAQKNGLYVEENVGGCADINVVIRDNLLIVGAQNGEESFRHYLYFTRSGFKVDELKAEMKNGVLKVFIPTTEDYNGHVSCFWPN